MEFAARTSVTLLPTKENIDIVNNTIKRLVVTSNEVVFGTRRGLTLPGFRVTLLQDRNMPKPTDAS